MTKDSIMRRFANGRGVAAIAGCCALLVLAGCFSSGYLKNDFSAYSREYGDSSNHQLLLNVARLSRDEPPYFVQLGQINQQHMTSGSLGESTTNSSATHPNGVAARIIQQTLSLGGTAGGTISEQPSFQFVPLNGDTLTQAITSPISQKVFLTLYDQGYPADELARVLFESIQAPDDPGDPAKDVSQVNVFVNDPRSSTYRSFLAVCARLRKSQLDRTVIVKQRRKKKKTHFPDANISDMVTAKNAGLTVTNPKTNPLAGGYDVTDPAGEYSLVRNIENAKDDQFFAYFPQLNDEPDDIDPKEKNFGVKLSMRTFISVLTAVSKEEERYKQLRKGEKVERAVFEQLKCELGDNRSPITSPIIIKYVDDDRETKGKDDRFLPILTLHRPEKELSGDYQELVDVPYKGLLFSVGDRDPSKTDNSVVTRRSNRRVFTLLSYLFTQIAVDPKKLPVQQFIQVQ
jgi:hypothetical protein